MTARRLFAGIALQSNERSACAAVGNELRRCGFAAAFEAPEKLHLTLAFLGNVAAARSDEMVACLRAAVAGIAPFTIVLDKLGAFPHERKPRVVYVGAREQGAAFRTLARAVRSAYVAAGFNFTGDPVAHVTIARVKSAPRALPSLEFAPIPVHVADVSLFESHFDASANTTHYVVLSGATLSERSESKGRAVEGPLSGG